MRQLLFPLLIVLLFTACRNKNSNKKEPKAPEQTNKVVLCHLDSATKTWQTINISVNDLPAHLAHGDIVPDADGDGYSKTTPCGSGNDCNDNNAAINPGSTEICGNNIDDNCNGQVDEPCSVTISNQTWMLKNLDVIMYRNGDTIPQVTDKEAWAGLTTGAWCYYYNDSANGTTYGKLYNWYAVNDPRGLAPAGWHIPTLAEWTTLKDSVVGLSVKEAGTSHWISPNLGATNNSGFTGLPGGFRDEEGTFFNMGPSKYNCGYWWSATENNTSEAWLGIQSYEYDKFLQGIYTKQNGLSVRCLRD